MRVYARGTVIAIGLAYGIALLSVLQVPRSVMGHEPGTPFTVRLKASAGRPAPLSPAPSALTPIEAKPVHKEQPKTGQHIPTRITKLVTEAKPVNEVPAAVKPDPAGQTIRATASAPGPAAPPDHADELSGRTYDVQPGGDTVIFALLINSNGEILSDKLMVPSGNALLDINLALVLKGKSVGAPNPPLAPGDTRWVDFQYTYPHQSNELP